MRRSLVLTDDSARHPFLRSLPAHVRRPEATERGRQRRRFPVDAVREFLLAYCACFLAAMLYFA